MRTDYRSPAPVALTIDDGPDPVWIPLVWESLANAHATFFVASEILYYFTREEMLATLRACERERAQGGVLLAAERPELTRRRETRCTGFLWSTRGSGTAIPSTSKITTWISSRTRREP